MQGLKHIPDWHCSLSKQSSCLEHVSLRLAAESDQFNQFLFIILIRIIVISMGSVDVKCGNESHDEPSL